MSGDANWLIYGANGYTGELIAREAVGLGMRPRLAGRNAAEINELAKNLGCEARVFSLDQQQELDAALQGMTCVVHCAGPFSATSRAMIDACLRNRVDYLDITGEIDVIEAAARRDAEAQSAGVMLLPAAGFDVVPSDCLAAALAERLPGATHLELAFTAEGILSRGTSKTMVESLPGGGRIRRQGRIVPVPAGWKVKEIPFRRGTMWAMTIPWGDVASAYHSTGIEEIEVYVGRPLAEINRVRWMRPLLPLLGLGFVQRFLKGKIDRQPRGPRSEALHSDRASLWGLVRDAHGKEISGTLETPGGYWLTVLSVLAIVRRICEGQRRRGFQTPSRAFGWRQILEIPGVSLEINGQPVERPSATQEPTHAVRA